MNHRTQVHRRGGKRLAAGIIGAAMAALAGSAHAALVAHDSFDTYTSGLVKQSANDLNGKGTAAPGGWAGAWTAVDTVEVVSPGLSYTSGSVSVAGGANAVSIRSDSPANIVASRSFTATSGEVYFSLLYQPLSVEGNDQVLFRLSNDTDADNTAQVGDIGTSVAAFSTLIRSNADSPRHDASAAITAGTTYFLVARLSTDGAGGGVGEFDRLQLWVNPSSATLGIADATTDYAMGISTVSTLAVRTQNFANGANVYDQVLFDELRIGTDAASVIPVPEPASAALIALGGVMLIGGKRRDRSA